MRSTVAVEGAVIETCEPCATCGEVTPHSRRRHAPLCWTAAALAALAGAGWVAAASGRLGLVAPRVVLAGAVCIVTALVAARADRARRWDLACNRCRGKAIAGRRAGRRCWRLPLRATTIDM